MGALTDSYTGLCPTAVTRPSMRHRWDSVTFLHWSYPVETVQGLLPSGLRVEPFDGWAWVGLVPFRMQVGFPLGSRWLFRFPETNVRTYVTGPTGEPGVWFFSLDAARLSTVLTARASYRVPYFWSDMSVRPDGDRISYRTRRRWPGPHNSRSDVEIEIGDPYLAYELTDFDHYLTARWSLFGTWGRRLLMARAEHAPWTLHRAQVIRCHDQLVAAAGLPEPSGEPVAHWSPGVDVMVGYPHGVG